MVVRLLYKLTKKRNDHADEERAQDKSDPVVATIITFIMTEALGHPPRAQCGTPTSDCNSPFHAHRDDAAGLKRSVPKWNSMDRLRASINT